MIALIYYGNSLFSLQILNYGIGGQYEPHVDYFEVIIDLQSKFNVGVLFFQFNF